MARRKRSGRMSRKMPVLATGGAVLSLAKVMFGGSGQYSQDSTWNHISKGDFEGAYRMLKSHAGEWSTYAPAVVGGVGSALAAKTGINRYFAKVPLFKF